MTLTIELYTSDGWIVLGVNYRSMKLFQKMSSVAGRPVLPGRGGKAVGVACSTRQVALNDGKEWSAESRIRANTSGREPSTQAFQEIAETGLGKGQSFAHMLPCVSGLLAPHQRLICRNVVKVNIAGVFQYGPWVCGTPPGRQEVLGNDLEGAQIWWGETGGSHPN